MNTINFYFTMIVILFGLPAPKAIMASERIHRGASGAKITCEEALKNTAKIKIGMKESEILSLLGTPTAKDGNTWSYNFWPFAPPPLVGAQTIIGVGLKFKETILAEIGWATICVTGVPAPKSARPKSINRPALMDALRIQTSVSPSPSLRGHKFS